jgi:hypothetical protein
MALVRRFFKFVAGAIRDPNSLDASSSRLIAWLCAFAGCFCAVYATVHNQATASLVGVITALIGGGAVALINRTSTEK